MRFRTGALFIPLAAAVIALAPPAGIAAGNEAVRATEALRYQPPAEDLAPRRVGGVTRGLPAATPWVEVLAPDHLGLTLSESPTLLWFLSAATGARIEVTLVDPRRSAPLVEAVVAGARAGIQVFDAGRYGVKLERGVQYEWSVAVVTDPEQRSRDMVTGGAIMLVAPADALRSRLRAIDVDHRAAALASAGIWYDALAVLSGRVAAHPGDHALQADRAALLEQAGLTEVAAFERGR
jgi:Domain of Unknown Function (DUF928)